MTVKVRCPNPKCRRSYQVAEEKLGKQARCKKCSVRFTFEPIGETKAPVQQTQTESQGTIPVGRPLGDLKNLGRFNIKNRLGAGAFGEVFRAHDPQLDRDVALKVPHPAVLQNPKVAKRFLIEARATARLTHPNIVPVFDAGRESGHHYIASAFIQGRTLEDALTGKFDFHETTKIVMKLAGALDYAHEQGIIHRDIKPANIMLDKKGNPHLMDFGLARLETGTENLTHDGAIMGTPAYMPPEQATGDLENVSPASDQYSLGVTLYEMLCGERPFSGPPEIVIFNVINQEPPTPGSINSDVPRDLETICLKAMAKNPQQRYPSCAELVEDLRRWQDNRPISARRITLRERFVRWSKRNPLMAGMMAILAAVVAVGMFMAYQAEQARQETLADLREARAAYVKQAAHAYRLFKAGEIETMNDVLEGCPERHRHWEWYYLWNEGHPEATSREGQSDDLGIVVSAPKRRAVGSMSYREVATDLSGDRHRVTYSRDGRTIATCIANTVTLWDGETGDQRSSVEVDRSFSSIAITSDGDRIALGVYRAVSLVDSNSGKLLETFPIEEDGNYANAAIECVAFSADDSLIIGTSDRLSSNVWDANSGRVLATLKKETEIAGASCAAFSPDGSQVVTGSRHELLLWNARLGGEPITLIDRNASACCVLFTPDGRHIISGSSGDPVKLWDAENGKLINTLGGSIKSAYYNIAISPDSKRLAVASSFSGLTIWDIENGTELLAPKETTSATFPTQSFFSSDGRRLIMVERRKLHFWDAGPDWKMPE